MYICSVSSSSIKSQQEILFHFNYKKKFQRLISWARQKERLSKQTNRDSCEQMKKRFYEKFGERRREPQEINRQMTTRMLNKERQKKKREKIVQCSSVLCTIIQSASSSIGIVSVSTFNGNLIRKFLSRGRETVGCDSLEGRRDRQSLVSISFREMTTKGWFYLLWNHSNDW